MRTKSSAFSPTSFKKRVKEFSMLQPTQRKMQIVKKRMPLLLNRIPRLAKKDRRKMREKGGNSQKERKKKPYDIYRIMIFRKARPSTNLTKRPPRSQVEMAHHINDRISKVSNRKGASNGNLSTNSD
uniref:Orf126 n=1 Tax=Batis maritima TaxID=4436 RepID=A0A068BD27_BATMA|nr:orf126 [Batis maritima]AIC83347.1 orf126 [Batis maritima]